MNSLERVRRMLNGQMVDFIPVCPIVHNALAKLEGISFKEYYTRAEVMASVIISGYKRFCYDGVQLSLGVACEAEAIGCEIVQSEDTMPVVKMPILLEDDKIDRLSIPDFQRDGRMPMFVEAVRQTVEAIGKDAWVIATIRGPLLIASQLRGTEAILVDLVERPQWVQKLFKYTTMVGMTFGAALVKTGAHAISIGEAICSPDLISPVMYRRFIAPWHKQLIYELHRVGCETVIMHICGNSLPIISDVVKTGIDVLDIDAAVAPCEANHASEGKIAFRGNLNPTKTLFRGNPEIVEEKCRRLITDIQLGLYDGRFILSSGCDIPPGTPAENIAAMVRASRSLLL
ncbi:MAG: uroporphyrinogen decarboxylase family protein [Planctomycetes bacterium]|nr:uroporphyrinogen decarboxylase family protein [Planctomycetota bacterium]